jgi:hypothetical protein
MLHVSTNQHGHLTFEVTGLALTREEEKKRMSNQGIRFGHWALDAMVSSSAYDDEHQLVTGQVYRGVLIFGSEIGSLINITTVESYIQPFGYTKPLAGLMPRLCEEVSIEQMREEWHVWGITGLHRPLLDSRNCPQVLNVSLPDGFDTKWLSSDYVPVTRQWSARTAFVVME